MPMNDHPVRIAGDFASIATIIGTVAGWLPYLAALAAFLWYGVLFYDRFVRPRKDRSQDGTNY